MNHHALRALDLITGSPVIGAPCLSAKKSSGLVRNERRNADRKGEASVHRFGGQILPTPAAPVSLKGRMTEKAYHRRTTSGGAFSPIRILASENIATDCRVGLAITRWNLRRRF